MGSGNSSPVEHARSVETETHQDVFELRFDHFVFGGTTVLLLAAAVGLCWYCRQRNKKHCRRKQASQRAACQCQPQTPMNQPTPQMPQPMMPPMPWYPMMPYVPPAANHWGLSSFPSTEPSRFTEAFQEPLSEPRAAPAQPPRPPPPRARELPPPSRCPAETQDTV